LDSFLEIKPRLAALNQGLQGAILLGAGVWSRVGRDLGHGFSGCESGVREVERRSSAGKAWSDLRATTAVREALRLRDEFFQHVKLWTPNEMRFTAALKCGA
jgi:hypothetical protein